MDNVPATEATRPMSKDAETSSGDSSVDWLEKPGQMLAWTEIGAGALAGFLAVAHRRGGNFPHPTTMEEFAAGLRQAAVEAEAEAVQKITSQAQQAAVAEAEAALQTNAWTPEERRAVAAPWGLSEPQANGLLAHLSGLEKALEVTLKALGERSPTAREKGLLMLPWLIMLPGFKRREAAALSEIVARREAPAASTTEGHLLPATLSAPFLNALQRGPKTLLSLINVEEKEEIRWRIEGRELKAQKARRRAQSLQGAVTRHQTRPELSLYQWQALWGIHALLRRDHYPTRLRFDKVELYEACGLKVTRYRGKREFHRADRERIDEAVQTLYEEEVVLYFQGEKRRGEFHFHIVTGWGREEGPEEKWYLTLHEAAIEMIQEQFVDLPPLAVVKAALEKAGASGRGGGMVADLEFVLWLHAFPFNNHHDEQGACTHVDWLELAERIGLGKMLAHGHRTKARNRLIQAYDRAVQAGYLVRYDLDRIGGYGRVDRLVKNTEKLREYARCKALPSGAGEQENEAD